MMGMLTVVVMRLSRLLQCSIFKHRECSHILLLVSWIMIHQLEGHVRPKRATGNFFSAREINGVDLFNLTLYRLICPKAYLCEVIAYFHNMNPAVIPYSKSQVYHAEERLGLWLKVGSPLTKRILPSTN
jgi:hypothetical protein